MECLEAAKAAANRLNERCMDLMWEANMTVAGVVGCEQLYKATGDVRYREIAYIPLANVLREAWLWECDFGLGEKTTNFWALFQVVRRRRAARSSRTIARAFISRTTRP